MSSAERGFRTRLPFRHDRVIEPEGERSAVSSRFRSCLSVRPARLVFQDHPRPRTAEIAHWIRDHGGTSYEPSGGEGGAAHFPFVYRGHVAALPEPGEQVPVRLWEEPSGRPLEADLPPEWFAGVRVYKGSPFRLVTWMVESGEGLLPRHLIEPLGGNARERNKEG